MHEYFQNFLKLYSQNWVKKYICWFFWLWCQSVLIASILINHWRRFMMTVLTVCVIKMTPCIVKTVSMLSWHIFVDVSSFEVPAPPRRVTQNPETCHKAGQERLTLLPSVPVFGPSQAWTAAGFLQTDGRDKSHLIIQPLSLSVGVRGGWWIMSKLPELKTFGVLVHKICHFFTHLLFDKDSFKMILRCLWDTVS